MQETASDRLCIEVRVVHKTRQQNKTKQKKTLMRSQEEVPEPQGYAEFEDEEASCHPGTMATDLCLQN